MRGGWRIGPATSGEGAAERPGADVGESVEALGAMARSEVGGEVELAGVVETVVGTAERDHAVGMGAAAEALGDQVGGVAGAPTADRAGAAGDLAALGVRGRDQRQRDDRCACERA